MIFLPIYEFGNVMVFEPGVPTKNASCCVRPRLLDLSCYGVWVAWQSENGMITPLRNLTFWFGVRTVAPPCWIVIFTGKGEFRQLEHSQTKEPVFCFH